MSKIDASTADLDSVVIIPNEVQKQAVVMISRRIIDTMRAKILNNFPMDPKYKPTQSLSKVKLTLTQLNRGLLI